MGCKHLRGGGVENGSQMHCVVNLLAVSDLEPHIREIKRAFLSTQRFVGHPRPAHYCSNCSSLGYRSSEAFGVPTVL
eukprot:2026539-Amphidinium_carterae.1